MTFKQFTLQEARCRIGTGLSLFGDPKVAFTVPVKKALTAELMKQRRLQLLKPFVLVCVIPNVSTKLQM